MMDVSYTHCCQKDEINWNWHSHTESLILLGKFLVVTDLWTAQTVKHNNCADFQEWVTSNSPDCVEDVWRKWISEQWWSEIVVMKVLWDSMTNKTSYWTDTLFRILASNVKRIFLTLNLPSKVLVNLTGRSI